MTTSTPDLQQHIMAFRRVLQDTETSIRNTARQLELEAGQTALAFLRDDNPATKASALALSDKAQGASATAERLKNEFQYHRACTPQSTLVQLISSLEGLIRMLEEEAGTYALNSLQTDDAAQIQTNRTQAQRVASRVEGYRLGLAAIHNMSIPPEMANLVL